MKNNFEYLGNGVLRIELTQKQHTLVDLMEYHRRRYPPWAGPDGISAADLKWCARKKKRSFYAVTNVRLPGGERRLLKLSRFFLGLDFDDKREADHINGDRLDDRMRNLRIVTPRQNSRNRRKHVNNTSGFKGVTWNKRRQRWKAYINDGTGRRRQTKLGYFNTEEEAAHAYDDAARAAFGEHGAYNSPRPGERSAITGKVVPLAA